MITMNKLAMILAIGGIVVLAASGTVQAQEPPSDTPGAWIIYPGGTEHYVGNDRHSGMYGSDVHSSIHEALGYSGALLCPGDPGHDGGDVCHWENYDPPPEGSIIELRGGISDTGPVWDIAGHPGECGGPGGCGTEKQKSLVVQQNGITIRGQDYDDGTGTMVQQEIFFNNGSATTALFYLEASDLTIENLHINSAWGTGVYSGYALAIGRYYQIGPDPHATGLTVTGNTFTNLRAMFDERPTVEDLTVVDNLVEDTYYNIFKKGVTFTGDNSITGNTFNRVGEGKGYPSLQILDNTGTTCIDDNTHSGWGSGQYAVKGDDYGLTAPINLGTGNTFVDQPGGSGAVYELYPLSAGGYAAGFFSQEDVIEGCGAANEPPVANPNGPYLGAVNTSITFDGTGSSDPDGDALTYAWDFGDSNTGSGATATHNYAAAGIYNVCLTVNDSTVDSDPACTIAVVYDPDGGFVTGGGWIWSPAGAYKDDLTLEGKATFGFVSKYKKGASVPEGNTEFVFQAADLNFHSSSYEWLVVAGARAKFKGTGTINGQGEYKFMLTAIDADINENDNFDADRFRIKIWTEDAEGNETVVYDNALGDDSDDATTEIGGGSIVIHTKKK
jgi:chitodextrinase